MLQEVVLGVVTLLELKKETPKKKASIAWGPTILAFSVIFALIFGLALVSEDINSGLKMITGINLAGPFTANYCD